MFVLYSCADEPEMGPASPLTAYDRSVISYFQQVALGYEFGNASEITRKWQSNMRIFVGGVNDENLLDELERVVEEINLLATDGFEVEIVEDTLQSNYYVFFGPGSEYGRIFPGSAQFVNSNWGLFSVFWNNNAINRGYMYVDTERADPIVARHLLREELTQSLGIGKDSDRFDDSIFRSSFSTTTEYSEIDRDVIRMLYHPDMPIGIGRAQVEEAITAILIAEKGA